jgi:RimJ/RimL family protein N-acetyltransferase
VIDPGQCWDTARLRVEPLTRAHAAELHVLLDDPALHEFIGGRPLTLHELTRRFTRWESRGSPDGDQVWANWVLRLQSTGTAVGTLQATLPAAGAGAGAAEVAWVVGPAEQGRGYASEAARSLVDRLTEDGWSVQAHVHPGHAASQRVARAAGLAPTDVVVDGEVRWLSAAGWPRPVPGSVHR